MTRPVKVRDFGEALAVARSAGMDAANRRARKAGRCDWTREDFDTAQAEMVRVLCALGYANRIIVDTPTETAAP